MARTNIKLFCGNSNPELALDVAKMLDVELSDVTVRTTRLLSFPSPPTPPFCLLVHIPHASMNSTGRKATQ